MTLFDSSAASQGIRMDQADQFAFGSLDLLPLNSGTHYSWFTPGGNKITATGTGFLWSVLSGKPTGGQITALAIDLGGDGVTDATLSGLALPLLSILSPATLIETLMTGADTILGGGFDDVLLGHAGADTILGGAGDDEIHGGDGADSLGGEAGRNTVFGGAGDDVLTEGGWDILDGGDGNDRIVLTSAVTAAEHDIFSGGDGTDILDLSQVAYTSGYGVVDLVSGIFTQSTDLEDYDVIDGFEDIHGSVGAESIRGDDQANYLWGGAGGDDTIHGGGGNDTIHASSVLATDDSLDGGDGDDMVLAFGGDDSVSGGTGDDTLSGGAGNDTILGGEGHDQIEGGTGDDSLLGGGGDDVFDHLAVQILTGIGADTIVGGEGYDTLRFDGAGFYDLSGVSLSGLEAITFSGAGGLFGLTLGAGAARDGFADGAVVTVDTAGSSQVVIDIVLDGGADIDLSSWTFVNWGASDMVRVLGTAADEVFLGTSGRDVFVGGGGFDTYILDGADSETDEIQGGTGIDRLSVQSSTDMTATAGRLLSIDEIAFSGTDATPQILDILAEDVNSLGLSLTLHVDRRDGTQQDMIRVSMGFADGLDLSGWTFANWGGRHVEILGAETGDDIVGSSAGDAMIGNGGDDTLLGLDGDDTIVGGAGADSMDGGAGRDLVDYSAEHGDFDVDLTTGLTSLAGEIAQNFEILTIGNGANRITGNDAGNMITTNAGNDTILGGAGNDTILAGNDDDSLVGGAGDDILNGGGGRDWIEGGAGADTLQGGNGRDTAIYTGSAAGIVVDLGAGLASGGDAAGDVLMSIEDIYGSRFADTITGDAGSNLIVGDAGDDLLIGGAGTVRDVLLGGANHDTLHGGGGGDILNGGGGNDHLHGEDGDDQLVGGRGIDTFTGGAGRDVFVFQTGAWDAGIITDWQDGLDRVRIVGPHDASDVVMSQQGADVLFTLTPTGETIIFRNIDISVLDLGSADFIFI